MHKECRTIASRTFTAALILCVLCAGAIGQTQPPSTYTPQLITFNGAPFGPCDVYQVALNVSNGTFMWCNPSTRSWQNPFSGTPTFAQGLIAPSLGPSAVQQHTIPAVASDVFGLLAATQTFSGPKTFSQQITSTVSTGTAPFSIASTTQVTNLNAQLHGGLSAPASAIVGISDSQVLTNKTLTSPAINGTPTGTGIPTLTLKNGSGSGNYTGTNTLFANVDTTNLCFSVTVPAGWKLAATASGIVTVQTGAVSVAIALTDIGATCGSGGVSVLKQVTVNPPAVGSFSAWALNWVITGDGAAHSISLQAQTANSSDAWQIQNNIAQLAPAMIFTLTPSN